MIKTTKQLTKEIKDLNIRYAHLSTELDILNNRITKLEDKINENKRSMRRN